MPYQFLDFPWRATKSIEKKFTNINLSEMISIQVGYGHIPGIPWSKTCILTVNKGVTSAAMAVELQYFSFAIPRTSGQPVPAFSYWPTRAEFEEFERVTLLDVEAIHQQARRHHRKARHFWKDLCQAVESLSTCCNNPVVE
eukprot:s1422_g26.t1